MAGNANFNRSRLLVPLRVLSGCVYAFLLLPLVIIFPVAFGDSSTLEFPPPGWSLQWFSNLWDDPRWLAAALRSLEVGVATVALAMLVGVPLSIALARKLLPGSDAIEKLISAPLVIPGIVYAVSVYSTFGALHLIGTTIGLTLAHTVLAMPFVVILSVTGLKAVDPNQELAALGLGAGPLEAFLRITLPQISASLGAAAFFAFMTSFDELIVALFIAGYQPTLPKKIFSGIEIDIDPTVAAVCVVQIAILVILLLIFGKTFRSAAAPD